MREALARTGDVLPWRSSVAPPPANLTRAELIAAINSKLAQFPGVTFNFTQPAEDAVDEAETGLKSSLDVKVFGSDLSVLEEKGKAIKHVMEQVRGMADLTLVQELGQPALTVDIDRGKIRLGIDAPRSVPIYRQELLPLKTTDTNVSGTSTAAH